MRAEQVLPSSLYGPARRLLTPRTAGRNRSNHIALTLDDGPDPASTPTIVRTLNSHAVRATFFLIGRHIRPVANLLREMHEAGHELAVHGWTHQCAMRVPPRLLAEDVARTRDLIEDCVGVAPRWYRPPYGIATLASTRAAEAAGLETMLWTAWGRDWAGWISPRGIERRVQRTIRPGGTVLLHDTDRYASPGSWRNTNASLCGLLPRWRELGWPVGTVREHWQ